MLDYLIKRPIGVILTFGMVVLLGVYLFHRIPVSLLPETDVPYLSIHVNYPGFSAEVVESEVTRPIRLQMLQVSGIEDVWSTTENGRAELELRFQYGRDMSLAYIEANEKLDQIASRLPGELERPLVTYNGLSDLPVVYITVLPRDEYMTDFVEFGLFCKNVIKRRLEQLEEVAFVDISGYDQPEIRIVPDYHKMQLLGVDESDIRLAIQQNNINLGSIVLKDGQYQFDVQFKTRLTSIDDLANIALHKDGKMIPLADIASIGQTSRSSRGKYLYGPDRGIILSVLKQPESNIFAMRSGIDRSLEVLRSEYPSISLRTALDQSHVLRVSIDNLRGSLIWGGVFAILILFGFYRRLPAIFLIAIVIPSTIASSLLLYYLLGLSINIVSLSGLILGVGLMVDNSIIIIENITQYRKTGLSMTESAIRGANEVFTPLLSSMLTTCAVFVPLLFMSGVVGALFYEQAISIAISLTMSLLIAYMIIPVLIGLMNLDLTLKKDYDFLEKGHDGFLRFSLKRPWVIVSSFILLLVAGIMVAVLTKKESFPPISREGIEFRLDWNQNITMEENERRCRLLIDELKDHAKEIHLMIGEQQFLLDRSGQNVQEARLICIQSNPGLQDTISQIVQRYCHQNFPFTRIQEMLLQNAFDVIFRNSVNDLYVQLRPLDPNDNIQIEAIEQALLHLQDAGFPMEPVNQMENLLLYIDSDKAMTYKIPLEAITQRLEALLNNYNLGELSGSRNNLTINLYHSEVANHPELHNPATLKTSDQTVPSTETTSPYKGDSPPEFTLLLSQAMVRNSENNLVPLDQFVRVDYGTGLREIRATQMGESFIAPIKDIDEAGLVRLKQALDELSDFNYTLSGPWFENQDRIRELTWVLVVSMLLLFLILSAQFESLVLSLIILLTLPFGFAGSLMALYLAGQSISILSMIGMIVMAGILVNDAILKLDMIVRMRNEMDEIEAIYRAGQRRIKPIFMTSMTTILALVPILFSSGLGAELQTPLALSIIGGITIGTLSSIVLLPLIYLLIRRMEGWRTGTTHKSK